MRAALRLHCQGFELENDDQTAAVDIDQKHKTSVPLQFFGYASRNSKVACDSAWAL